ncbi:uncharacterized protein LOC120354150 [Nilaparvata lugens]|uniref:uncharacterized protein LOC120354150 n=1 Tax=Nilaparvata lugens TaxID=108931 RepID=UPI00193E0BB1|nr:uncharacterized protein LOC120354150 [Nilaparvata lugens]
MCYFAFFQSVMAYGITLWGSSTHVRRVLLLQKRALRILCNAEHLAHCRPLFIQEGLLTVYGLYIFRSAVNAFGDLEVQPVRGDSHEYDTRNRLRLDLPYCRLGRTQSSVVYLPGKIINKLPISVRSLPVAALKRRLKHFLQENPFYSLNEFFECDSALVSYKGIPQCPYFAYQG